MESKFGKIDLIDVREIHEYKGGHVPTAKNIPMGTILAQPEKYLNKSKEYYIICHAGSRSLRTCKNLSDQGYNVINILGGTKSYPKSLVK